MWVRGVDVVVISAVRENGAALTSFLLCLFLHSTQQLAREPNQLSHEERVIVVGEKRGEQKGSASIPYPSPDKPLYLKITLLVLVLRGSTNKSSAADDSTCGCRLLLNNSKSKNTNKHHLPRMMKESRE